MCSCTCTCTQVCSGDRALLFAHMFNVHKFNVGLPDNLVHVNELLDLLQTKINALQCIYCEKIFKRCVSSSFP